MAAEPVSDDFTHPEAPEAYWLHRPHPYVIYECTDCGHEYTEWQATDCPHKCLRDH